MTYLNVPLDRITVLRDERQRRVVETEDIQNSIKQIGLINPIIVRQDEDRIILVAGERRLTAYKVLNAKYPTERWAEIPVRFYDQLTVIEAAIIELEENVKRRDLPWQDLVKAVVKLHTLHMDADPDWNQGKTAEAISVAEGTMSMFLRVAPHMEDSRITGCSSLRNAYDVLYRRDERRQAVARSALLEGDDDYGLLEDDEFDDEEEAEGVEGAAEGKSGIASVPTLRKGLKLPEGAKILTAADVDAYFANGNDLENGVDAPGVERLPITVYGTPDGKKPGTKVPAAALNLAEDILHGSFLEWATTYSKRRFDLIHCDFPYGNKEIGPQMLGNEHEYYEDSPELYMELLTCLCENLDNIMAGTGWIIFWYSERMRDVTREIIKVKAPSLTVQTHPLIWIHSDNTGISPDFKRRPRHIYDTALLMHRGPEARILKLKSDAYAAPTDHKLHPSTKPEPMLRYFFEMFVDRHTHVLDPTCGSGSSLRAAESLDATKVLGIEANWEHCETARSALKEYRQKARILDAIGSIPMEGEDLEDSEEAANAATS